jgi:hypothetical protein
MLVKEPEPRLDHRRMGGQGILGGVERNVRGLLERML